MAELAARQRGVVTRTQLRAIGLSADAVDKRLKSKRLHPLYRGVYVVGHSGPVEGAPELGAVLACGSGAVVSHRSAAVLWGLHPAPPPDVEVTVGGRRCDSKRGIRVHRVAALDPRDLRKLGGIPITAPARTLLDLAGTVSARELEQALAEAHARGLVRRGEMVALLARYPRRPGIAALRSLIAPDASPALTRSEAEERLLAMIRAAELPAPEVNVRIGRHEVDFLWSDQRLVVEVDGFRFHSSRTAFERDRARDAELASLGFLVIRVTWRQIVDRPSAVVARIAGALAVRA
jgi:very-short-patch-repair endonuclease